ncbi:RNA polymerase Rpb8 [Penicillium canariense]|uniref:DNA-directed RNA polymerases I, II, and III subunit RPABC3 n=1 Tax=Penicillium canariense TaxID=189055 RepID=A0A9W9HVX5_9EURO|nr:RNA polymerase Rpb8 [Penicillium canariense]KAJ5159908.1 RNA polymerase Rpb8 [Penicillium canariense]
MSDPILFEDTFTITDVNSQKYDRVSRITCQTSDKKIHFHLDVNTELYPCAKGDSLSLALASTLSLDGKEDSRTSWREVSDGEPTLANDYDYVCHGKVYRFQEAPFNKEDVHDVELHDVDPDALKDRMAVLASFGGLLLYLVGPYKKTAPLRIDHVYLLLKK